MHAQSKVASIKQLNVVLVTSAQQKLPLQLLQKFATIMTKQMENVTLQLLKPHALLMVMLPLHGMQQIADAKIFLLNKACAPRVSSARKAQLHQHLVMPVSSVHRMALVTIRSVLTARKVSIAILPLRLHVLYAMVATSAHRRQLTRQLIQQRQVTSLKMVSQPKSNASQVHIRTWDNKLLVISAIKESTVIPWLWLPVKTALLALTNLKAMIATHLEQFTHVNANTVNTLTRQQTASALNVQWTSTAREMLSSPASIVPTATIV